MAENIYQKFISLKNSYRNYDTKQSLLRMQKFRRIVTSMQEQGYDVALDLLGSINFGIVEKNSDADLILYCSCAVHAKMSTCPDDCPTTQIQMQLITRLADDLGMPPVEILDSLNLNYLHARMSDDLNAVRGDEGILRFIFYRMLGRPVNRPLLHRLQQCYCTSEGLMDNFNEWSNGMLQGYIGSTSHRYSFKKYNERLVDKGHVVPERLLKELQHYLEESDH